MTVSKIRSIDGIDDFGHYYVCIKHLIGDSTISYIAKQTGLNYRTIEKLVSSKNQRTVENKTIERICYCFQCKPEDICFYIKTTK